MKSIFTALLLFSSCLIAVEPIDVTSLKDRLHSEWTEITLSIAGGCDCVGTIENGIRLTKDADDVALSEYGTFGASEKVGKLGKLNDTDTKKAIDEILLHFTIAGELNGQSRGALPINDRDSLQLVLRVKAAPLNGFWTRVLPEHSSVSSWIAKMKANATLKQ